MFSDSMKKLMWKWQRLRAMRIGEVSHRARRYLGSEIGALCVHSGWSPRPRGEVKPKLTLFGGVPEWRELWQKQYSLEANQLDELIAGYVFFFGYPKLHVGTPVDWHKDPLTGTRAPLVFHSRIDYRESARVGNVKVIWELGRHQHLVSLAVAYAVSGERTYKTAVVEQIESWIATNPYGIGIHWCSALEVALRLISWAAVHSLLSLRDGENGLFAAVGDRKQLGAALYQQAYFVRHNLSRHSSANNHLIGELTGLFLACLVFDLGSDGQRWATAARVELEREAVAQVHPDGVNKEQSSYYHLWVLEYLLVAWLAGSRAGYAFSQGFGDRIVAMARFLKDLQPDGGIPPQIGDADDGAVMRFDTTPKGDPYTAVLAAANAISGRCDGHKWLVGVPQKAFWYGLIRSGSAESLNTTQDGETGAPCYPHVYRNGGYAVLRGGNTHLVFDAGPLGYLSIAAHGHADALSFCAAIDGIWWLLDPGTSSYHDDPRWRNYFRGTAAHNTLLVDNCDQSLIAGPFLWHRHAHARLESCDIDTDGCQVVRGSHDGYQSLGVRHIREVRLTPERGDINVCDIIDGNGEHELALHFHFAPEVRLAPLPDGSWVAHHPGSRYSIQVVVDGTWQWRQARGSEEPILGWYSSSLGHKQPSATLQGHWRGSLPCQVKTCLCVLSAKEAYQQGC
jgi:hypothetical protein